MDRTLTALNPAAVPPFPTPTHMTSWGFSAGRGEKIQGGFTEDYA